MPFLGAWPGVEAIETRRLTLEPLRLEHADEIFGLLAARRADTAAPAITSAGTRA